jgi:Uma2 family endonuclease
MSTAPVLPLMTVAEYDALPDPIGDFNYELHFGRLVEVGKPKKGHYDLQETVCDVLSRRLDRKVWKVGTELPYGLTPTYDARATDIGVVLRKIWDAIPKDGFLVGAPALVVEVKSPSNRDRKMEQDAIVHITHGACAVWIVKEEKRQIVQVTASSRVVYGPGDNIPLPAPLSVTIPVDEIFLEAD